MLPATLARHAGRYQFGPHAVITIGDTADTFSATLGGVTFFDLHVDRQTTLLPLSTNFYVDGRYHTRISFVLDANGIATGATANPGRWQQVGTRIGD